MSELENLKEQLKQVDRLIAEETDEEAKKELMQTKLDLEELVQLMADEDEEKTPGGSGKVAEENEEESETTDDLIGSRCMAPFDLDRSLALHTAIIMDIDSASRVRVLFSHPTCPSMKACSHFLSSTCRYNSNCRFSHGYSVQLERIRDYEQPDYTSIVEQGLVLVKGQSDLWELGRINAIDGQDVAVKVLKNGTEVSAKRKDLVPIGEVEEEKPDEESWKELKKETLGGVAAGNLGEWNGGDIGMKLMMKMGYKMGEGLGKKSDGIVHAIQARICPKNASLDEIMTRKRKHVDGKLHQKPKKVKKILNFDDSERDIFAFINRKLEQKTERTLADVRKEQQEMASYSAKSLGVKNLDLDLELKQLKTKHKKLKEGIQRNQSDKNTVTKMRISLQEVEEKIAGVERKKHNVQTEVNLRNAKRKDVF